MKNKTLSDIFSYLRKYRVLIAISFLIALISVIGTLYIPVLAGEAIDCIIAPGKVDFSTISGLLMTAGILAGACALLQWLMNYINNRITYRVVRDIRNDAFRKLEILPLKFIDSHAHGDILSRIIADVDQFSDGLLLGFTQLFTGIVTILGTLFFMFRINLWITLAVVVLTPISLFVARFIATHTYEMFHLQSTTRGEQTALIEEMITNQKVVQAFSQEQKTTKQFDEINQRLQKSSLRAIFYSSITNPSTRFVNSLVYAVVALTGAFSVISGRLTVGGLSCFLNYANQYTKPFNEISGVITELQNAFACAARIFELIDE